VDELVDSGLHVGRGLPRAQRVPLEMDGCLGNLRVGDRRVPLDGQLDLDLGQLVDAAVELVELPLDIAPHGVGHVEVLALDLKLHRRLPWRCFVRWDLSNPTAVAASYPRRSARANAIASTRRAPAARRAVPAVAAVAPVV